MPTPQGTANFGEHASLLPLKQHQLATQLIVKGAIYRHGQFCQGLGIDDPQVATARWRLILRHGR